MYESDFDREYQEFMEDSLTRKGHIEHLIPQMEELCKRHFDDNEREELYNVLKKFEIEDGVSIFMTSDKPADKKYAGRVDLPLEFMNLYIGKNRAKNTYKKLAIGLNFVFKKQNDLIRFNQDLLSTEYPLLCNDILSTTSTCSAETQYILKYYPKAGVLVQAVKSKHGSYLKQTPDVKGYFVPNQGIGFYEPELHVFHIYDPKARWKATKEYERRFVIN